MQTPDWNKIADTAEQRLEAAQPGPAERLIMRRLIKDFEALPLPGKLTFAMYVDIVMAAEAKS